MSSIQVPLGSVCFWQSLFPLPSASCVCTISPRVWSWLGCTNPTWEAVDSWKNKVLCSVSTAWAGLEKVFQAEVFTLPRGWNELLLHDSDPPPPNGERAERGKTKMASWLQHNHLWQPYFVFSPCITRTKGWILGVPNPCCTVLSCFQGYQLIQCKSVSLPAQLSALHKLLFGPGRMNDGNLVPRTSTEGSERIGRKSLLKWRFISIKVNSSNRPGTMGSTTAQQVTKALHSHGSLTEEGMGPWSPILSK